MRMCELFSWVRQESLTVSGLLSDALKLTDTVEDAAQRKMLQDTVEAIYKQRERSEVLFNQLEALTLEVNINHRQVGE